MKKLLLFTLLFLAACSPQKRLNRIADKYNLKQAEKIIVSDTIIVPGDTLFFTIPQHSDTVIITPQAEIRTVRADDSIIVRVCTPTDTVYKEIPVEVQTIKYVEQKGKWGKSITWWLVIVASVLIIFKITNSDLLMKK